MAVNSGKSGEVYIQGLVRFRGTIAAKGQPAPPAVAEPFVSDQSQPVEHLWTVTRSSQDHARKGDHAQAE